MVFFPVMKTSIWVVALLVLCACSQTTSVQQPAVSQPTVLQTALDTINFGIDPLWREADSTLALKIPKSVPVTSIMIVDRNFILLDTTFANDTLRISLRFQSKTLSNHSGQCLIFSSADTLANLTLIGETSPFERRVGDSYIYGTHAEITDYHYGSYTTNASYSSGFDSVWISALPLTISTSLHDTADLDLEAMQEDTLGDIGGLPIVSRKTTYWQWADTLNPLDEYFRSNW